MENMEKYTTSELIFKAENPETSSEEIELYLNEIIKRLLVAKISDEDAEKFYNLEKFFKEHKTKFPTFSELIANGDEETFKFRLKLTESGLSEEQINSFIENEKAIIKRVNDEKAKDNEGR